MSLCVSRTPLHDQEEYCPEHMTCCSSFIMSCWVNNLLSEFLCFCRETVTITPCLASQTMKQKKMILYDLFIYRIIDSRLHHKCDILLLQVIYWSHQFITNVICIFYKWSIDLTSSSQMWYITSTNDLLISPNGLLLTFKCEM